MASYVYFYEADFGDLTLVIKSAEDKIGTNRKYKSSARIMYRRKNGVELDAIELLGERLTKRLNRSIRNGRMDVRYTGGFCSNGDRWGSDDICHNIDDLQDDFDSDSPDCQNQNDNLVDAILFFENKNDIFEKGNAMVCVNEMHVLLSRRKGIELPPISILGRCDGSCRVMHQSRVMIDVIHLDGALMEWR